nr:uncharacterized protein LOC105867372 [Microcebus murinus]
MGCVTIWESSLSGGDGGLLTPHPPLALCTRKPSDRPLPGRGRLRGRRGTVGGPCRHRGPGGRVLRAGSKFGRRRQAGKDLRPQTPPPCGPSPPPPPAGPQGIKPLALRNRELGEGSRRSQGSTHEVAVWGARTGPGTLGSLLRPGLAPTEEMALLPLLLVLGLPLVQAETNSTARQAARLQCHVCEEENDFACKNPSQCGEHEKFCGIITVSEYCHSCWGPADRWIESFEESGSV